MDRRIGDDNLAVAPGRKGEGHDERPRIDVTGLGEADRSSHLLQKERLGLERLLPVEHLDCHVGLPL